MCVYISRPSINGRKNEPAKTTTSPYIWGGRGCKTTHIQYTTLEERELLFSSTAEEMKKTKNTWELSLFSKRRRGEEKKETTIWTTPIIILGRKNKQSTSSRVSLPLLVLQLLIPFSRIITKTPKKEKPGHQISCGDSLSVLLLLLWLLSPLIRILVVVFYS